MRLWKVADEATALLMTQFYDNWLTQGMPKPQALKAAQQQLKSEKAYAHPAYWGAFVMLGR